MITMLYEKTLSRKVISTPVKPQDSVSQDGMDDIVPPMETERPRSRCKSVWEGLCGAIKRLFSTTNERPNESKDSMGKILNMMRHASLAVLLFISQLTLRPVMTSTR